MVAVQRCDWPISRYVEMSPTAVSAPAIDAEQRRSNQRQECCFALREFQVLSPETTGVTQELWPLQRLLNILSHLHTKPSPDHCLWASNLPLTYLFFSFHLLSTLFFSSRVFILGFPSRPLKCGFSRLSSVVCVDLLTATDVSPGGRQHWQQEWKIIFRLKQVGRRRLFYWYFHQSADAAAASRVSWRGRDADTDADHIKQHLKILEMHFNVCRQVSACKTLLFFIRLSLELWPCSPAKFRKTSA